MNAGDGSDESRPTVTLHRHGVGGRDLECQHLQVDGSPDTSLVFLHEGLGSISLWRDFPARLASATGLSALVYSRHGNGGSSPLDAPRAVTYMHDEALEILPAMLSMHGIERPILIGHSDGASIGILYAGAFPDRARGLVAIAPHLFVEPLALTSIAAIRPLYESTALRERMARHHLDVDRTFYGWNDIWLHPAFAAWNIEDHAARIRCPTLAIQGIDDEYGTMRQIERLHELASDAELLKLESCGHSPHRDQPERLLARCTRFIRSLPAPAPRAAPGTGG